MNDDEKLLGMNEVCQILGCKVGYVYQLMRESKLPYYALPKRQVKRGDLNRYIATKYVAGKAEVKSA